MGGLSKLFKSFRDKINAWSRLRKIATGAILTGIIAAMIILGVSVTKSSNAQSLLFNNLDPNDSKLILQKLEEAKVTPVIKGNAIYVPSDQVDRLRLELAPTITNGSKGFELFDDTSKWGMTDKEMDIKYQRALSGELERTIKSFPQVENSTVHLNIPADSIFVKDAAKSTASVTLILKPNKSISTEQVKSIVALVCGSVKNLPKENVSIVDNNMKLLTKGLFEGSQGTDTLAGDMDSNTEKQQVLKKSYEENLKKNILSMLEEVYGVGKVKVSVNADLNFDAEQQTIVTVDPKNVPVSQKTVDDTQTPTGSSNTTGLSPNDNNQTSTTYPSVDNPSSTGTTSTHKEITTNFETGKTQISLMKAPGQVKRQTVSVVVDGTLELEEQNKLSGIVKNAIGYNESRGDSVTVEGIQFNNSSSATNVAQKDIDANSNNSNQVGSVQMYIFMGIALAGIIILLSVLKAFRKKNKKLSKKERLEMEESDEEDENTSVGTNIDSVLGENILPKEPEQQFQPIDFEPKENEKSHTEKELKKYATEKPEQVLETIRSWLSKDER